ncbi:von Willebrand factor D and EGF domain-containing protein-like [Achroia grisella]|uniref:von Willebrand factor D and EGF domain-containing protein-like n=1 Tax=Achroia grisella TaxID=688607 RepID=UPI0027D1FC1F|nr:von Willebrand factor D and EGF domain-containing protein-like [Achroia grisella]
MKAERFCVLFVLCCINFAYQVDALKAGEGVCTVKSSVRKTKIRIVTQTKNTLCGKKKCVVKIPKRVTYLATVLRTVCCNGWEYLSDKDLCIPQCSTGCLGGRCTAPNVCVCDPPMYLDPEHRNNCIKPTCDPPCVNAECTFNNTCNCLKNFTSFNATHCLHCESGYSIDTTFKCKPQCTKGCENGTCTAPDVCTCLPGFSKQEVNQDCKPVCEKCVNASCTGPNVCSCWEGYNQINDTHCSPKCDDCDGICVGPNICECSVGYKKINDSCTPICNETCQNAVCTAPNVCSCFDGYLKKKDKTHCKTYLATVLRTVCCNGWEYLSDKDLCIPQCSTGFNIGGRCTAPIDVVCNFTSFNATHCLHCEAGYSIDTTFKCKPQCTKGCENGTCTEPDVCTCLPGFSKQEVNQDWAHVPHAPHNQFAR